MASPSEIAALEIRITGVEKAISQFSNFQQTTTKTMSSSEAAVTRSLKNMVSQFVGVAAAARAVQNVISSGVGFNQFVENTTTSFTVMMKSAEKAKQQMKDLYDFAVSSPLTFKETAASSKQLMAYGFAAKELIPTMKTLGSVAIATGHSLDDISYVYGTLKSQGRAYSRDLMQFGMRGIPIYEELAKVLSVDVKQIQKMASEGKIGFAEVEKAFQNMTSSGGRFSGIIEGYMSTLTGKLSMLSDIAQQSSGTIMSGVTNKLKGLVDNLTNALKDPGMQDYFETLSVDIGHIAGSLFLMLEALVKLLPLLTLAAKIFMVFAVGGAIYKGIAAIPSLLFKIGDLAIAAATKLTAMATAEITATTALASMTTGIKLFGTACATFIAANPWLVALMAIAAVGGTILTIQHVNADKARESTDSSVRAAQLAKDYQPTAVNGTTSGYGAVNPADIAKIAEQYKLADSVVANILTKNGALNKAMYTQYMLQQKNLEDSKAYAKAVSERKNYVSKTIEEIQADYFGVLNNMDPSHYMDPNDWTAYGGRAASEYIKGLQDVTKQKQSVLGSALLPSDTKDFLQTELAALLKELTGDASQLPEIERSGYLEGLRKRIIELRKQIEDVGDSSKKVADELAKWWAPLVQAAKLTLDPLDDIDIAMQQAQESAKKEFDSRQAQYDLLIKQASTEELALKYQQDKTAEAALFAQYQQDITKEYEKQKNLAAYNQIVSGNDSYWSNMQAEAGKQYGQKGNMIGGIWDDIKSIKNIPGNILSGLKSIPDAIKNIPSNIWSGIKGFNALPFGATITQGKAQLMQGTQVGTAMSNDAGMGVDILSGMTTAMVSFLQSIENVNKVLNPFSTIIEAARSVLEPLINQSLQPIVNILEMVGEVLGELLRPVIAVSYIIKAIMYPAFSVLVVILQAVGWAFTWLYDIVIVPVGNMIVNIVNAIIKVLNKIPFVHIRYLDALETSTEALKDYADAAENAKSSLSDTISYLEDKLSDMIDEQISSFQDLYEVGAISASEYADAVKNINAQSINKDTALVSLADQQLGTQAEILARLSELYQVQEILNTSTLTDKQIANLLNDAGLTSTSIENVLIGQIDRILAAMGSTATTVTAPEDTSKYDAVIAALRDDVRGKDAVAAIKNMVGALSDSQIVALAKELGATGAIPALTAEELRKSMSELAALRETKWYITGIGGAGLSVGTTNVPYDNFPATLHKGEAVVPSTFMDGIRSGELVMSSGGASSEGTVNVYVSVEGSVTAEDDLAATIATNIYKQRKLRTLTV